MKNIVNNSLGKGKLKLLILLLILIIPVYTNVIAQPFVSVYKNGTSSSLSIYAFETGTVHEEASSSADSINQGLWSTIPVIVSFSILMFFVIQFLIQIIRDRKLGKNSIHRT